MQFVPDIVTGIFSGIRETASKIKSTAKQVKANKYQSTRLSERVDGIVEMIGEKSITSLSTGQLTKSLGNFHNFLLRSLEFIQKFTKAGWFTRIMRNSNHAEKFHEINEELSQHSQDLALGLQLTIYRKFMHEDKIDAKNDLEEITEIIHTQQTLFPTKPNETPTVKIKTNNHPTTDPKPDLKHRSNNHHIRHDSIQPQHQLNNHHNIRRESLQPSRHILHLMNKPMRDHRQSALNHWQ